MTLEDMIGKSFFPISVKDASANPSKCDLMIQVNLAYCVPVGEVDENDIL